jgi:non-ribosomal peptide synthetase component E (peptide arylation enzyme)
MTYKGAFQSTILGRAIRLASRGKLLRYQDEIDIPEQYRRHAIGSGQEKDGEYSKEGKRSNARRTNQSPQDARTIQSDGHARSMSDDTIVEGRGRDEEDIAGTGEGHAASRVEKGSKKHPHLVDWYGPDDHENPYAPHPVGLVQLTCLERTGQPATKHS